MADGGYDWSGGIFLFAPEVMLGEMADHRPDIHAAALEAVDAAGRDGPFVPLDDERFLSIFPKSDDIAVMERTKLAAVAPCDIIWADVAPEASCGGWAARTARKILCAATRWRWTPPGSLIWCDDGMEGGLTDLVVVGTPAQWWSSPRTAPRTSRLSSSACAPGRAELAVVVVTSTRDFQTRFVAAA